MRQRLPPLNALRLFEAAARLLSFKNAAEELLVTPSAVSHGIQSLEQWLGAPLFVRTARGIVLTEAGASYYPTVQSALAMIAAGSGEVAARHGRRHLTISVAPTFASRLLMPRLAGFRAEHPDISVVIDTTRERVDFADGIDLAIRMGRGGWQGVIAQELLRESLVPVCAPELEAGIRDAVDLAGVPLIHVTTVSEDWAHWARATGRRLPDPERGLRFDTVLMAYDAAARGLGVAIGRRPLVDAELAVGTLVTLWEPAIAGSTGYWLVSPESRAGDPDIAAFRAWMTAHPIAME
ncbi:transcriptional regulator GcvA [Phreatobacter stygius]|uniref:Transcriptional regulator GcvA n=1 Tax=Phreatobacter stygius TaxID=1940610 RepID=A0A4D7AXH9_9HYPH|nr:transcriptional regulator GcvA [Phreatobacter stygius]QCI63623.1 transcriptional regulator GcvA [Phreatobacter stygius]